MDITAVFAKTPTDTPAVMEAVQVSPTQDTSRDFLQFIKERGIDFDNDTGLAFVPATKVSDLVKVMEAYIDTGLFFERYQYGINDFISVAANNPECDVYISSQI